MKEVEITEVCPRDGFQNVKAFINTEVKIEVIKTLMDCGFKEIEIASFVSPKWVPQMADSDEVIEEINKYRKENKIGVKFIGLAANSMGVERAIKNKVDKIDYPISVSERHNRDNVNRTRDESMAELERLIKTHGIDVNIGLATTFGTPYEDEIILIDDILAMIDRALKIGVNKITLSDTVGNGDPIFVEKVLKEVKKHVDLNNVSMHLHDTMGMALANILVGLNNGVRNFESAAGGIGGCPFAPGAAGNVATEDVVNMLNLMGYETGIDLKRVLKAVKIIDDKIATNVASRYYPYYKNKIES